MFGTLKNPKVRIYTFNTYTNILYIQTIKIIIIMKM